LIGQGATERDFAYSGLEDSMADALGQICTYAKAKNVDFRTAAMMNSINKVARVWDLSSSAFI